MQTDLSTGVLATAWASLKTMKPRPALSVGQWATNERTLDGGVTAKPGRFVSFPYQIEPQEAFRDPEVIETVLLWASRLGKTEMLLNAAGYCMHHDPMSILIQYPTEDSAEKFSKKFLTPMINNTPVLQESVMSERSRDGGNTILNKSFTGGTISMIGSNSPSKLRQVQAPCIINDEIDAMEDGPEGDPVDLSYKRADNYRYSIQICSSTPTLKGSSRIEARYNDTDKRNWFVPCWKCNSEFVILREHIDWESVGTPDDPVIICPKCGHPHDDHYRQKIVSAGVWVPTAEFNGYRGYWLNAYNTLLPAKKGYNNRLHQFVSEYLKAKAKAKTKGSGSLMVFVNTVEAETFEEKSIKLDAHQLSALKESYESDSIPDGILWLSAGVDTQPDRFEIDVWGFGKNENAWHVETHVIPGDPKRQETKDDLDEFLLNTWTTEGGRKMQLGATFVDSGGDRTKEVYSFVRGKAGRRIFAIKGASSSNPYDNTLEVVKQGRSKKYRCTLLIVHSSKIKKQIYDKLRDSLQAKKESTSNDEDEVDVEQTMRFGKSCDNEFFQSLVAEKLIKAKVSNKWLYKWRHDPSQGDFERNERLDNAVYAFAAKMQFDPNFERIAKKLAENPEKKPESEEKTAKRQQFKRKPARKRTWATSY